MRASIFRPNEFSSFFYILSQGVKRHKDINRSFDHQLRQTEKNILWITLGVECRL